MISKILSFVIALKRYWKELLFFSAIFITYSICTSPGFTWACLDNDFFNFVWAAKFLATPHFPGYPLQTFFNIVFIRIPIGTEGWRLAWFSSTLPAVISCILVYLIVKKQTNNRWSPYVASVALAGCNVFISQAIVAESYSFAIMVMLSVYLAYIYKKEKTIAILAGLGLGTHPIAIPAMAMMGITGVRKRWWWIPIVIFVGLYSWCILRNDAYVPWMPEAWKIFTNDCGNLPLVSLPERLRDTAVLLCCGFGLSLIPSAIYLFSDFKKSWLLLWSMVFPVTYWMFNSTEVTIRHFLFAFPFIAIAAGLGMDKVKVKSWLIFGCSAILLLIMPFFYDIGVNLDTSLGAQKYYDEIQNCPKGSVVTNIIVIAKTNAVGSDERTQIPIWILNRLGMMNVVDLDGIKYLDLSANGENYRRSLREKYGFQTPVFLVLDMGGGTDYHIPIREAPLYKMIVLFAQSNPDVTVYYTEVPEEDPMMRIIKIAE